jgi:2'-5' RNA ligase
MDTKELYFIALLPHNDLRISIREIKEDIYETFGAGHALRSPAHITLQRPFKRGVADEAGIVTVLRQFALGEKCFGVELNGYGAFPPRVIYIKITDPGPVRALHLRLKEVLVNDLDFSREEIMNAVQPHITVATRDLTGEAFGEAWPEFMNKKFHGHFEAGSIFLLKHNGRNWDIFREFPFGNK